MVFHKDAPENEKLVLKRSILGLGRVMYLDVARMLEQIKSCLRYRGARFLYALNTNTALLNISFSLKEGERERERQRQRQRDRESDSERERERVREGDRARKKNSGIYYATKCTKILHLRTLNSFLSFPIFAPHQDI